MAIQKTINLSQLALDFASKFDEELPDQHFKAVIGGDTGAGKSAIALGFPKIHYICFDDSWRAAYKHARRVGFTPDIVAMDCASDFVGSDGYINKTAIYNGLKEKIPQALENEQAETVIIDNLSSIYDLIEFKAEKEKDVKNQYSKWNIVIAEMLQIFGYQALAKKNVIILCHWEIHEDEGEKTGSSNKRWYPKVPTSFRFDFGKEYSNFWNVKIDFLDKHPSGNFYRKLQVMPSSQFRTLKTGTPLLEDLSLPENPKEIYELLKKEGLV